MRYMSFSVFFIQQTFTLCRFTRSISRGRILEKKKKRSTTFHSNRLKYDSGRLSCPLLFHDVSPFRHWPTLVLGRVDRTKIKSRGNKSTMERTLAKITGPDWDRPIHESERRKYIKHKTESVSR